MESEAVRCGSLESAQAEDVELPDFEYEEMLVDDGEFDKWAKTYNWV